MQLPSMDTRMGHFHSAYVHQIILASSQTDLLGIAELNGPVYIEVECPEFIFPGPFVLRKAELSRAFCPLTISTDAWSIGKVK